MMTAADRIQFIKNWIKNYCNSMENKPDSLVVGVSGGIDSAVVSTISAMTGIKVKALSMPIRQLKFQDDLSRAHLKWLKNKFSNVDDNLFVKPVKTKIFTGGIKKKLTEIVCPDEDVWVSDPLDIEAEFRYYVMDRKILGSSRYDDKDNDCFPNEDVVRQIIEKYKNQPAGYAIDVGVVGGETILIEVNDGWALGYYPWGDFTRQQYVDLITARWKQIDG